MMLTNHCENQWYMDSSATAHLINDLGTLNSSFNYSIGKSIIIIGNGFFIPVTSFGSVSFSSKSRSLSLTNVLVTPSIIKNLVSIRRFSRDNSCSIEFDPFDFSVKCLQTWRTILRSDITSDLYPVFSSSNNASQQ